MQQQEDIKLNLSIWRDFSIRWNPEEEIKEGCGKEDYIHIDVINPTNILDGIADDDPEANDGIDDDVYLFRCKYRKDK